MHIKQMLIIVMIAFVGSQLATLLSLPIPASVLGLLLLFGGLVTKIIKLRDVEESAMFMINNLSIFFVVPTVGIMLYFDLLAGQLLQIIVPLISSILLGMLAAGKVTEVMIHLMNRGEKS